MAQPSPGTAVMDADHRALPVGAQHGPGDIGRSVDEFAGHAEFPGTCFENCSPIRTRCPGPAAQMSLDRDGPRWMPVCRRAVS
jgi:hypothetical protein